MPARLLLAATARARAEVALARRVTEESMLPLRSWLQNIPPSQQVIYIEKREGQQLLLRMRSQKPALSALHAIIQASGCPANIRDSIIDLLLMRSWIYGGYTCTSPHHRGVWWGSAASLGRNA